MLITTLWRSREWRRARREVFQVRGRSICLSVRDGRPDELRELVDLAATVRGAVECLEQMGGEFERLVAEQLLVVGAFAGFPAWQSALCGVHRSYVGPFNIPTLGTPWFIAIELYGAAGVSQVLGKTITLAKYQRAVAKLDEMERVA